MICAQASHETGKSLATFSKPMQGFLQKPIRKKFNFYKDPITMMNKILTTLLLILATVTAPAQNDSQAKNVLDKALAAFNSKGGAEIAFRTEGTQGFNGTISVKNNKFRLQTPQMITWFDGKTQWTYLKNSEEVNVTTPSASQSSQLNPQTWLQSYRKGYSYKYGGLSNKLHKILLTAPQKQAGNIKSITLWIKSSSYTPAKAIVTDRNGQSVTITVTGYTGKNFSDSYFRFNAKDYPNAEIIDLR
jgi:outer membrane lipoprotein-sorting protein